MSAPHFPGIAWALSLALALGAPPALAQSTPRPTDSPPARASSGGASSPAPAGTTPSTPSAGPATTAPTPPPSASDKAIAARKYQEGAELAKQARWKEALPPLVEAWNHLHHWQIAASLGRVEIEVGQFRAAEQHLAFALAADDMPADARAQTNLLMELTRSNLGTIRIVATAQARARVLLDGTTIGTTPFTGAVSADPGSHEIELRFGTASSAETVVIKRKETREVTIDLRVPELDTPLPPLPATPDPETSSRPQPPWPLLIALGGTALLGATIGTGLWVASEDEGVQARQRYEALPHLPAGSCTTADCQAVHDTLVAQQGFQTGAFVTWSVGAAALAGAGVLWFLTSSTPRKRTARVVPIVTANGQGLVVQGSW